MNIPTVVLNCQKCHQFSRGLTSFKCHISFVIPREEAFSEEAFQCDQCDSNFKSENGLKIQVRKTHKKVNSTPATPDPPRQRPRRSVSLSASPLLDASREKEEFTVNTSSTYNCCYCDEMFTGEDKLDYHNSFFHQYQLSLCQPSLV